MKTLLNCLVVLAGLVVATPLKQSQLSNDALNHHNANRAQYGARPLTYDNNLASGAASYAAQCYWGHSGGNYGENLYMIGGSEGNIQDAVQAWMDEASIYNYNDPGFSRDTAEFTQLVWKSTTTLGCGISICNTGNPNGFGQWTYIVCRYTPPGNVEGQFVENVGVPRWNLDSD